MSGIAGIVHFDGAPVAPGLIEKMTAAMASRGPDGLRHWRRGSVALGQCMLRTTPESLEERQPLANEDESLVLVMDGRVDDYEALRRELLGRGAVLRDRSDAELVLRAYEIWGEDCPDKIIGEYVFFIWDARNRCLFGARDAIGTRHFYYHAGNGWFGFASEIKGLLALGRIEPRLNESRLLDYLVVQYDRDDEVGTFYQGISRLPAGHAMRIGKDGMKTWRYWTPGELPEQRFASLDECVEAFLDQFRTVVECRLRSIGPVGAMLSGGMDSSSIVGLIASEFRGELKQPLKTFSLIRADRENCHDWQAIREILKDDWFDACILTSDIAAERYQAYLDNIGNLNEPFALSQGFTDSLVFHAASERGCKVVMDGMAADLFFYDPSSSMEYLLRARMFSQLPALLAAYRRHGIGGGGRTLVWRALRHAMPEPVLAALRDVRRKRAQARRWKSDNPGDLLALLHPDVALRYLQDKDAQRAAAAERARRHDERQAHAARFTTGLLSFAHEVNGQIALSLGVEPRSPFSDRRIVEFALRMPLAAKLAMPWYKHVLRQTMVGKLPEAVLYRPNIGGHPGWRFIETLAAEMARNFPEVWDSSRLGTRLNRWVDADALSSVRGSYSQRQDYSAGVRLFTLAVLGQWLQEQPGRFVTGEEFT